MTKYSWLLCLSLLSCASHDPTYYNLQPRAGLALHGAPHAIELQRVTLAGYLDRADIVRGMDNYKLQIADGARWGEDLGDMAGRVLTADLTTRLPESVIFDNPGAIDMVPDLRVEVDIAHFDRESGGTVTLDATIALLYGHDRTAWHQTLRVPESGDTIDAQAAAMSTALGQLADDVARHAAAIGPAPAGS